MSEFSRAQERDEKRRIGSGMKTGVFALLLCWVPLLGALLASVGFVRVTSSVTRRYRGKRRAGILLTLFVLILALAVSTLEIYTYTHSPWVLDDMKNWLMDNITGGVWYQQSYDYNTQPSYGMGISAGPYAQGYTPDGYYSETGEFIPYAEAETGVVVGEDETGG